MIHRLWLQISEKTKTWNRRLLAEIACYLVLAGIALYVLLPIRTKDDLFLLIMVLVVFTYLILKTLHQAEDK
jgi:hypothetical protein